MFKNYLILIYHYVRNIYQNNKVCYDMYENNTNNMNVNNKDNNELHNNKYKYYINSKRIMNKYINDGVYMGNFDYKILQDIINNYENNNQYI